MLFRSRRRPSPDHDAAALVADVTDAGQSTGELRRCPGTRVDLDARHLVRTDHAIDVIGAQVTHVHPVYVNGRKAAVAKHAIHQDALLGHLLHPEACYGVKEVRRHEGMAANDIFLREKSAKAAAASFLEASRYTRES